MKLTDNLRYRLVNQYMEVEFLTKGLGENFVMKRHQHGKWSVHENLAHLGRYQENFQNRVERILGQENPRFERYRAEDDVGFETWVEKPTLEIIKDTRRYRKDIARLILEMPNQNLSRTAVHPKLGKMNVVQWVEFFALHESHHIYTIFWIVHQYGDR